MSRCLPPQIRELQQNWFLFEKERFGSIRNRLDPNMLLIFRCSTKCDGGLACSIFCISTWISFTSPSSRALLGALHGRLDLCDLAEAYRRWAAYPLVAISDSQRSYLPHANWIDTIPHGVPEAFVLPKRHHDGYLAFLGRIAPEKGRDGRLG